MKLENRPPVYYSEYLQLDKILNAQELESKKEGIKADDEMLFIIIHQSYELWFKQILHEVNIIRDIFKQPNVADNSPDIFNINTRLDRVILILEMLVSKLTILETMSPLDFLDFRDLLRPASGFQSIQFKILEASLGLEYTSRHGQQYYISQLNEGDIKRVKDAEKEESLIVLLNGWLERMPFASDKRYWNSEEEFWTLYRDTYSNSLLDSEKTNLEAFDSIFGSQEKSLEGHRLSPLAMKNALFILLYRDYPLLQLPFEILDKLLQVDEQMSMWRYRHVHMVQRAIGKRVGTGGSTGAGYLRAAAESHVVFRELAELNSFLVARRDLPELPETLKNDISFGRK
ncbi:MAG TPA: tryptophan 2,3-dioxygenase family protein [Edaphocola sp.]|nr:tryptophan 2,3-dioxygenase family protein [Edaphocola sp.]